MLARYAPLVVRKRPAPIPKMLRTAARLAVARQWQRGAALRRFEGEISGRLGGCQVAAVSSGRFALLMVLEALGVRPPDTIILPSYNASCVPNVLQAAGFNLHFVDVDPRRLTVTAATLQGVPDDASVLLATHIEGCPAPMAELRAWSDRHKVWLVEDAAHALGATVDGSPVGSLGDGAIFSLGRGKHLNTLGGGLAVIGTAHAAAGERLRALADGLQPPPVSELAREVMMEGAVRTGTNPAVFSALAAPVVKLARRLNDSDPMSALFEDDKEAWTAVPEELKRRLSNLQAAFGLASLGRFDANLARRRGHAERMRAELDGTPGLRLHRPLPSSRPAWLELTAMVGDRDRFQRAMLAHGVDTQRSWMDACHALDAFDGASASPCPVSEEVSASAVYLPTYASLSDSEVDRVMRAVVEALR